MDERKHFWEMMGNHFQNSWSKDVLRMCYSLYRNFTFLMSLEILWYLNLCKTKGHFLVSIIYHKEVRNTGFPMTGPWSMNSPYYIISKARRIPVRAKSRLRDTIKQTWYYHICVILCKHEDINILNFKPILTWHNIVEFQ